MTIPISCPEPRWDRAATPGREDSGDNQLRPAHSNPFGVEQTDRSIDDFILSSWHFVLILYRKLEQKF